MTSEQIGRDYVQDWAHASRKLALWVKAGLPLDMTNHVEAKRWIESNVECVLSLTAHIAHEVTEPTFDEIVVALYLALRKAK